ncbi:hypothetical protein EDB85DRAFT_1888064 [Lactarius pseudohatsudake]|nr:hypothetical protein EDB85DRAFT_1888064 [Lactarius pseudohatsudake]
MASGRSFRAAGYRWWRLMVTGAHELTCSKAVVTWSMRNDTKTKKNTCRSRRRQPGSWGVSHGGENLRQWRGVWADVWRGGDVVTRVLVTIVVAVGIVDDGMHEVAPME